MSTTYRKNIIVEYLFIIACNLDLTRGLWMIYLALRGFSLIELGIFESAFHITSFLMEVPTGAVADIWGRKASRLWGRVCFLGSLVIMFTAGSFFVQLLGFMVCAVGYNLESGAGDALVYDSLKLDGEASGYKKVAGRREFLYQASAIVAYVVGGYLATRDYSYIFIISIVLAVASILVGSLFSEPVSRKKEESQTIEERPSVRKQTALSIRVVRERPRIAFLILFSEIIFAAIVTEYFYLQNYWKGNGFSEFQIGVIFAVSALTSGVFGLYTNRIEKRIGEHGVLLSMPVLLIICLWGIALTPYHYLFYIMTGVIQGILSVAISDYINMLIPSGQRATILSFQSMAFSFIMIILFPLTGLLGDHISIRTAFIVIAAIMTAGGSAYLIYYSRRFYGNVHREDHQD